MIKIRITNLTKNSNIYTSNVYLIRGDWNAIEDKNTLIDVGRDKKIFEEIEKINTGVGKQRIDKVIITHNHYDHVSNLNIIVDKYHPKVYAYSKSIENIDVRLRGGEIIHVGENYFEVIHLPGHSSDSIALYSEINGWLFMGENNINIKEGSEKYSNAFINNFNYISTKKKKKIYPGHGPPIINNCQNILKKSLINLRKNIE